ncbi:hypothetical protein ACWGDT_30950 [Streptomyces avermitilis]
MDGGRADDAAVRTAERLKREGMLYLQQAPALLYQKLTGPLSRIWEQDGHITVGRLWEVHTAYPYMYRLVNRLVLDQGIEDILSLLTWETEGFALATAYDETKDRYQGLVLPGVNARFGQITDNTVLVRVDKAISQREHDEEISAQKREAAAVPASRAAAPQSVNVSVSEAAVKQPESPRQPVLPRVPTRFYANAQLTPEQYSKNASKYVLEILQHLDLIGTEVEVTIEIQAKCPKGFPEDKVRILRENANTLKLKAEFETE